MAPDSAFVHLSIGLVLAADGRHAAAEAALRLALELDPADAEAITALAEAIAAWGRVEDAAELPALAARTDPRDASVHESIVRYVRGAASGWRSGR